MIGVEELADWSWAVCLFRRGEVPGEFPRGWWGWGYGRRNVELFQYFASRSGGVTVHGLPVGSGCGVILFVGVLAWWPCQ